MHHLLDIYKSGLLWHDASHQAGTCPTDMNELYVSVNGSTSEAESLRTMTGDSHQGHWRGLVLAS